MSELPWWNSSYPFRRQVFFDLSKEDHDGDVGRIYLPITLVEQGKIRADFFDVRLVFNGITVFDKENILISYDVDTIKIEFPYPITGYKNYGMAQEDRFYVYFGDKTLSSADKYTDTPPPTEEIDLSYTLGDYTPSSLPLSFVPYNFDSRLTLTRPTEDWIGLTSNNYGILLSPDSATSAKAVFDFYGKSVGIYSIVSSGFGIIKVKLDDQEFDVDLFEEPSSDDHNTEQLVFFADNLNTDRHKLTILNQGQRNIMASELTSETSVFFDEDFWPFISDRARKPVNVTKIAFSTNAVGEFGKEEIISGFLWNSKISGVNTNG